MKKTKNNMSINDAEFIIDKIKEINKNCVIIITGGEPFLHPGIFRILDYISKRELTFTVLTNGILISDDISQKLKEYKNLINIQISLDGFKKETHALTRGNTFDSVMRGIKNIIKHKLPFSLAPTIHNRNLDEIYDIAEFAFSNEGGFTPNNLRDFNKDDFDLYLSNENLTRIINDVEKRLKKKFSKDYLRLKRKGFKVLDCNRDHFICGMGYSLF
jgi:MoaA/NifB/PqqE/SkfB family radical SAM enzyme